MRISLRMVGAVVVVGAMSVLVTGRAATTHAADPFRSGQRGVAATLLSGVAAGPSIAKAALSATALGLRPAATRTVAEVVDHLAGAAYQEVTDLDANGRMLALQRFDPAGRLVGALRFGWTGDGGPNLASEAAARSRAEQVVGSLGSAPGGTPRMVLAANGGWTASWTRTVAGIPVPGDGVRLQLWADGSFHGLSRVERSLAPAPAVILDRTTIRRSIDARLDGWFTGASRSQVVVTAAELAWIAPNDTFAPLRADVPASVLRLAWVARIGTTGALATSLRGLEIYLDAGDGSLLGGDVLR